MKNSIDLINRSSLKISSILFVLVYLWLLISPTVVFALSGKKQQVEYLSYESFNTTDMVNLSTGDFTYNIPLLEVPGPEGAFKLPLAYHGGIGLNEEASWVGLGWSLNSGSINRSVSGIPDDYAGQPIKTEVADDGYSGYAFEFNIGVASYSYDSERGAGGHVAFAGFGFGFGTKSMMQIAGLTITNHRVSYAGIGLNLNDGSISGYGVNVSKSGIGFDVKSAALSVASSLASQSFGSKYQVLSGLQGSLAGLEGDQIQSGHWTIESETKMFSTSYDVYLDYENTNYAYGSIYLAGAKGNSVDYNGTYNSRIELHQGDHNPGYSQYNYSPPDPYINYSGNTHSSYFYNIDNVDIGKTITDSYEEPSSHKLYPKPNHIAFDRYQVFGENVMGAIEPYRIDIGSLSPKHYDDGWHTQRSYHLMDFLDYSSGANYLPQFRYLGEGVNHYNHHLGNLNNFEFGYSYSSMSSATRQVPIYSLSGTLNPGNTVEAAGNRNDSYKNHRLRTGRHVEWVSNWDLMSNSETYSPSNYFGSNPIYQGKIMDHLPPSERSSFRSTFPKLGIGGYAITSTDGMTYHYTIPLFSKSNVVYNGNGSTDFTKTAVNQKYATQWLLTSITGNDFIDRNNNGMVDNQDYGYWVKFDYGKFSSEYKWREPYLSQTYATVPNDFSSSKTYSESGTRESYYLNSIQTRTHTAIFIKSIREDGRGFYDRTNSGSLPASSLRLDEVILLKTDNLNNLKSNGLSIDNSNISGIKNTDNMDAVWDGDDINSSSLRLGIEENQLTRIQFNYVPWRDPSNQPHPDLLCKGTYNSFPLNSTDLPPSTHGSGGKLTLKSISVFGTNDNKLAPDYIFSYSNNNYNYHPDKFDGWGMYKNDGNGAITSHGPTFFAPDNYCLKEILTPTGQTIEVDYEKDTYRSIAGDPVRIPARAYNIITPSGSNYGQLNLYSGVDLSEYFKVGDIVYMVSPIGTPPFDTPWKVTINEVGPSYLKSTDLHGVTLNSNYFLEFYSPVKDINKPGGNNRVSKVTIDGGYLTDPNSDKYVYSVDCDLSDDALTSGVASFEPEYISLYNRVFTNYYDYPKTPIMYSEVNILHNYNDVDQSYLYRSSFEFQSLTKDMIEVEESQDIRNSIHYKRATSQDIFGNWSYEDTYSGSVLKNFIIEDKTGLVGKLLEKSIYNNEKQLISSTDYNYKVQNSTGLFSHGTILLDRHYFNKWLTFGGLNEHYRYYYRMIRTRKWKNNYVLKSTEYNQDGVSSVFSYQNFDPYSGNPLTTLYTNSKGDKMKSVMVTAHQIENLSQNKVYPLMGSKFYNPQNKNLLMNRGAEYVYNYKSENDTWFPLKAKIQIWSNNWDYREYNSSTGYYELGNSIANDAYRKKATYVWNGETNDDGTFKNFTDFNWDNISNNPQWLKTSENTLYDHYSHLLESVDVVGKGSSSKMNSSNSLVLAQASNSKYTEFAFSGAEDELTPDNGFGGEVHKGGGSTLVDKSSYPVHTGNKALRLDNVNEYGFVFKKKVENGNSKKLRASVWVHQSNMDRLRLAYNYYDTDAGTSVDYQHVIPSSSNAYLKAGDWYLIILDIPKVTGSAADWLHVQTWYPNNQAAGAVIIDDFRVHPYDGTMTASVYDESSGELMASVNPSGLCEKYEYDASGRLTRIFEEVPDYNGQIGGFKLRKELDYGYSRSY